MIDRRTCLRLMATAAALPALAPAVAGAAPGVGPIDTLAVDTHAHVFTRDLTMADRRRYTVDYDATPAAYLAMLAANRMARGVLVQPSFLGFDNRYLLSAIAQHPRRLRGIVALANTTTIDTMRALHDAGIAGIRLNLIGRADPELAAAPWQDHLAHVAALGWQVEIQCEAARLPALLPALLRARVPVVVDHFGRPDPRLGLEDPGFAALLRAAATGQVYVKLSGAYRVGQALADEAAPKLLEAFGPDRLLWGSDWPHTQFEAVADATRARAALDRWVPDAGARARILSDTPAALFGFDGTGRRS